MLEMQLGSQRMKAEESVWTKLGREAEVVLGGTAEGTYEHGKKALADPATLAKMGSAAVIATGLTMAQGKGGIVKLGAQVLGLSMAGAYAKDVYGHGAETWNVMQDTWSRPDRLVENKTHIKNTLGPFVVDFGIFTAGGAAGIGAGKYASSKFFGENRYNLSLGGSRGVTPEPVPRNLSLNTSIERGTNNPLMAREPLVPTITRESGARGSSTKALVEAPQTVPGVRREVEIPVVELGMGRPEVKTFPVDSQLAKVYEAAQQSVGKIEVLVVQGKNIEARTANATNLGEGKMVTNFHVVQNATDMYVMDAAGKAHRVRTVAYDEIPDVAIVQFTDKASQAAFSTPAIRNTGKSFERPEPGPVAAVGHYDGQNALHVSPGMISAEMRQNGEQLRFMGCIKEGNCGGPVMNMNGEVLGIVKQGTDLGIAAPSWQFNRVLQSGSQIPMPKPILSPSPTVSHFEVDASKARINIATLFDTALEGKLPAEFFHSKVRRVQLESANGSARELVLRTQLSPGTRQVVVEPIALDGRAIDASMKWPGTNTPIGSSRLTLEFEPGLQSATMRTVNDPHSVLKMGFAYRANTSYLAGLNPKRGPIH